ncbi:hypothetical protein LJR260_005678 [Variovorax paradoxus]|uniref:Uncharacterized protein n=1 Tax=Variovorax paradoxus TaxID=34073 RepID=A0AAW8EQF5_VARPD|nr:hypothetical protein [Variovorax paradoxus]MDP9974665.1 hypothetical protein [Variovorax paradoxus]
MSTTLAAFTHALAAALLIAAACARARVALKAGRRQLPAHP